MNWKTAGRHILSYVLQGINLLVVSQDRGVAGEDWMHPGRLNIRGCG